MGGLTDCQTAAGLGRRRSIGWYQIAPFTPFVILVVVLNRSKSILYLLLPVELSLSFKGFVLSFRSRSPLLVELSCSPDPSSSARSLSCRPYLYAQPPDSSLEAARCASRHTGRIGALLQGQLRLIGLDLFINRLGVFCLDRKAPCLLHQRRTFSFPLFEKSAR